MNKKTKNIVSVIQSVAKNLVGTQWMPSGSFTALHMTKSTLYSVLCTLCTVLFLASCTDESLVDNPQAQNALRTVSVDLGMPQGKPAFGEGTTSRAADAEKPAEILLGDSTLAVSRTSSDTYYTTSNWVDGDWLLVKIEAGSTQGRLTLEYHDSEERPTRGWHLLKDRSYFKYKGDTYYWYNNEQLPQGVLPILEITESDEIAVPIDTSNPLTIHLDWTATAPTVSLIYINPESMSWDNTGKLSYEWGATEAPELWIADGTAWTTPQARLRVHTGAKGDVVKLTSSVFDTASDDEPGTYEATTDAQGNAYFYGATTGELKGDFIVQLTKMRVHVSGEGETANSTTLNTNVTLLEASDVVPVTLDATKAYKLVMSEDKRNATTQTVLSVIDGQCGITEVTDGLYVGTDAHVAAVKKQIETAVAMGITEFTVINELAIYDQIDMEYPTCAATVVGEAIRQLVPELVPTSTEAVDYNGSITLTLADATVVIDAAFLGCTALKSVSAPAATLIGQGAFIQCTGLEEVELDVATEIDPLAFLGCTALQSVSAPAVTTIYNNAFNGCTDLQTVTLGHVTNIAGSAFSGTQVTDLNFDYLTTLGGSALSGLTFSNLEIAKEAASDAYINLLQNAFSGCTLTGSVKFHRVVGKENHVDGVTKENAFEGVTTSNLDLYLAAEQPVDQITVEGGMLKWAGAVWKSITIGNVPLTVVGNEIYPVVNGVPTTVIDGETYAVLNGQAALDVTAGILEKALATETNITNFYVINQLTTNVGEAIKTITPAPADGITLKLADATSVPANAFNGCEALASVSFEKSVTIGDNAFSGCTALTGMDWTKVASIGAAAFGECTITGTLTLGEGVTVNAAAFQDAIVSNCDLVLPTDQESNVTVSNGKLMWAGAEWKSITVGDKVYTQETGFVKLTIGGTETYAVIDGMYGHYTGEDGTEAQFEAYRDNVKDQIKAATARINSFYVINELGTYKYLKKTIVNMGGFSMEKESQVTSSVVGQAFTAYANENTTARVSITLADATSVPQGAFEGCTALENIELDMVESIGGNAFKECTALKSITTAATTIEGSAFYDCTSLESATLSAVTEIRGYVFWNCTSLKNLTFGAVITKLLNGAFNNVTNCDLTLASGQQHMNNTSASSSGTSNGTPVTSADANALEANRTWGCYTWKSITISNNQ